MSTENTHKSKLKQIAQQLGVSASTVSIVLNGRGDELRISKATQQRVQEAARTADYTPNVFARKLRKSVHDNARRVVGVFWSSSFLNESMGGFFYSANSTVEQNHYDIEFSIHFFNSGHLREIAEQLDQWQFHGMIFCGMEDDDVAFLESLELTIPVILPNHANSDRYSSVSVDNADVGKRCASALLSHGYRRIGIIGRQPMTMGAELRRFAFLAEIGAKGGVSKPEWSCILDNVGYRTLHSVVEEMFSQSDSPDALFALRSGYAANLVLAVNGWNIKHGENRALLLCGHDDMLKKLALNSAYVNLGIGEFASSCIKLVWLLMNGAIEAPVKWMITPTIDDDMLQNV